MSLAAVRALGEDRRRGVGADVAGDARSDVEGGVGQVELEVSAAAADGVARRQRERGAAEWRRVDAEHEVVHDRVADDHDVEHPVAVDTGGVEQLADQLVDRLAHGGGQLAIAAGVHHHVGHAAHQVLAEADLRVHPPPLAEITSPPNRRRGARRSSSSRRRRRRRRPRRRIPARRRRPSVPDGHGRGATWRSRARGGRAARAATRASTTSPCCSATAAITRSATDSPEPSERRRPRRSAGRTPGRRRAGVEVGGPCGRPGGGPGSPPARR